MQHQVSQLIAEREQFAREADRLRGVIQLQERELERLRKLLMERADQYRAIRERFGVIKFFTFSTQPVKRIYKNKNNNQDKGLTAARVSP
jgi:hypothetical protein